MGNLLTTCRMGTERRVSSATPSTHDRPVGWRRGCIAQVDATVAELHTWE